MKYQKVQPKFRRKSLWRRIVTPRRIAVLGVFAAVGLAVFTFFYFKYSRVLDAKLRGEVMIRTSGIYAQPRTIKPGQKISLAWLKAHLDGLGYQQGERGSSDNRGRYTINGQTMLVEPGADAVVDRAQLFPSLVVTFSRDGGSIVRVTEKGSTRALTSAQVEPELLTSLSNNEFEKRKIVRYEDLPKHLIDAIVAIEDRRFYEHGGVDYRGLTRAVWVNVTNRELQQGGSTVTQQLVKNMFLTPERTYKRKLQEAFIAIVLETRLSKREIMQLYCNEIFLGQQGTYSINGFGEASRAYFNKTVAQLEVHEAALLAGMIRGPSLYSPYSASEKARERRNQVLDAMAEMSFITSEVADREKARDLGVRERRILANANAPYFVDYLQHELERSFPGSDLSRQALRIYSSIDMELQQSGERAVRENLAALDKLFATRKKDPVPPGTLQAALVALNPRTGEIYAMVGGRDYEKSQLNRASDAKRQPGSVFKPIVYAAAIESAYGGAGLPAPLTAATPFLDKPEQFVTQSGELYAPDNYGKSYTNRELPLREGLVNSLNVVTVRVAEKVGLFQVQQTATKLGLPKPPPYLATALGTTEATPLEMAGAYTAFAELGRRAAPTGIVRVTDEKGTTVRALRPEVREAMHPQTAYILTDFMKDVMNRGTAAGARARGFTAVAAGKTGTSRDGWFAGYTPNLVCVVYVGFDDGSQLGIEGSKSALPIWADFMKSALRLRPELGGETFPKPDTGVVEVEVDAETGQLATPACVKRRTEIFIDGSQPKDACELHDGTFMEAAPTDSDLSVPPYKLPPKPEPSHPGPATEPGRDDDAPPSDRPRRTRPPADED